jgi:hypothetical protein
MGGWPTRIDERPLIDSTGFFRMGFWIGGVRVEGGGSATLGRKVSKRKSLRILVDASESVRRV